MARGYIARKFLRYRRSTAAVPIFSTTTLMVHLFLIRHRQLLMPSLIPGYQPNNHAASDIMRYSGRVNSQMTCIRPSLCSQSVHATNYALPSQGMFTLRNRRKCVALCAEALNLCLAIFACHATSILFKATSIPLLTRKTACLQCKFGAKEQGFHAVCIELMHLYLPSCLGRMLSYLRSLASGLDFQKRLKNSSISALAGPRAVDIYSCHWLISSVATTC